MNHIEVWKDVHGFEGHYQISNCGNVKSLKRTIIDSVGHAYEIPERILKSTLAGRGYEIVTLYKDGKSYHTYIHQLVMVSFCCLDSYK